MSFEFNSDAVQPQSDIVVDAATKPSRVVTPRTDAERIETARAVAAQNLRENSRLLDYAPQYAPEYFQDYGFGSCFLASHLTHLAQLIGAKLNGKLIPLGISHYFNPRTGVFEFEEYGVTNFSLADIGKAYYERIAELGLSEVLLEEWACRGLSIAEDRQFHNLSFDERMATFRAKV